MLDVLSHLSNRHLSRSLTGNPSHVSEGLRKLYCEQKHSISHVRKNIFYHKVIFFCVCKKIISCCCLAHFRYIKILSWLRCFRNKIANFSRLQCLAIPRRDLSTKKTRLIIVKILIILISFVEQVRICMRFSGVASINKSVCIPYLY